MSKLTLRALEPEPRPMCEVCGRPVEKMATWADQDRCVMVYKFWCHGETERSEVSQDEVLGAISVTMGSVFRASARRLP